jgi:hypothetical protein
MKLTKAILNKYKIHNSWQIAEILNNKLFLAYNPIQDGRAYRSANWKIVGINFKTDPDSPWYNGGCKTFSVFGSNHKRAKKESFDQAINWIKEKYGLEMTDRDIWGNYHQSNSLMKLRVILEENKQINESHVP